MEYISTRGDGESYSFKKVVMEGLARDGGLFVPQTIPDFSSRIKDLENLSYQELAVEIFQPFIGDELSKETIQKLVEKSYSTFSDDEVTPISYLDDVAVLELFHGPTLAFKDVALQFLGNLFEELIKGDNATLNILGATSGDTGSAAIYGVRGKKGISIFMLHPKGKISPFQEKQMTTVLDENVFNIAIDGTFDDGQNIIKAVFNDLDFKDKHNLGAVNSINWARVMAQIVYYFKAAFDFKKKFPQKPLVFSVPTGNFGDIYAGYLAKKMGLPIDKLILATNENDILFRTLTTGKYKIEKVFETYSPAMDIQISSNFERFLFDILGRDSAAVREKMSDLSAKKEFSLSEAQLKDAQSFFKAVRIDTKEMMSSITAYHKKGYLLDPHSAVGVSAALKAGFDNTVCLSTAHPIKFNEAVVKATGEQPALPSHIEDFSEKETKCLEVSATTEVVKALMVEKLEMLYQK